MDTDCLSKESSRRKATGKFDAELVPVGSCEADDGIRACTTVQVFAKLKPSLVKGGVTTVGNSLRTTDGVSAVL
jgi:acetyl-CoA C-acetyltransferase